MASSFPTHTSTTPPTPRPATSTGKASQANSSPRVGTPSGSTLPNPKSTGLTLATRSYATKKSPSATVPSTPTSTPSSTTKAFNRTGARQPTRSAPSSSLAPPSSVSSESAQPSG